MLDRAREWWGRLGRTNQLTLGLTTLGVLIALVGFITWAGTPDYVPLFSNLSAQDANAITEKLREGNVPSKLAQGGAAIEVPAQYVDEWRMKIVSAGLPAASTSATTGIDDVLSGHNVGDTSDMEQLRMRRSLENSVSKSLMMMDPIANAIVHYAASDNSPLLMSNHDSSAAVLVTTKPGHSLSDENVHSIVKLTQMSYTGLQEKNISVTDSQGAVLFDSSHTGGAGGTDIDKVRRKFESDRGAQIQTALNLVCGPRGSIVAVSAEFNTDTKKEIKTDSTQGVIVTKSSTETKLEGKGTINSPPAPGAGANINGLPTAPAAGATGTPTYPGASVEPSGRYTENTSVNTYAPGTDVVQTDSGPGKLEKMSVSVLVDSNKYKDAAALASIIAKIKETVGTYIMLVPGEAANARMVSVVDMPFDHSQEMQDQLAGEQQRRADMLKQLAGLLVPFVIMGVALFLLARALRQSNPAAFAKTPMLAGAGAGMGMGALPPGSSLLLDHDGVPMPGQMVGSADMIEGEDSPLALSTGSNLPKSFEVIEETFDADLESILHLTRAKPEMVALLLKSWMSEEQ